jgi:hypothetical protein
LFTCRLHYAWMRDLLTWVAVLLLLGMMVFIAVRQGGLRRDIAAMARRDAERQRHHEVVERQVRNLLGEREEPEDDDPPRRRLWLVPVVALLAFIKTYPGPAAAGAAVTSAAALTWLLVSVQPESIQTEPPTPTPIIVPTGTRSPSFTTELPPPGTVEPSSRPPGGGTTRPAPTTLAAVLLPPTSAALPTTTTVAPTSTTTSSAPTTVTTTTVMPPEQPRCLLTLRVDHLLRVCVPLAHR